MASIKTSVFVCELDDIQVTTNLYPDKSTILLRVGEAPVEGVVFLDPEQARDLVEKLQAALDERNEYLDVIKKYLEDVTEVL